MKIITNLFISILFIIYQSSTNDIVFANQWGLEEQATEYDKCDSVILHYDGKSWNHVYDGFNMWLSDIYGFSDNDIFAIGKNGAILHYTW